MLAPGSLARELLENVAALVALAVVLGAIEGLSLGGWLLWLAIAAGMGALLGAVRHFSRR